VTKIRPRAQDHRREGRLGYGRGKGREGSEKEGGRRRREEGSGEELENEKRKKRERHDLLLFHRVNKNVSKRDIWKEEGGKESVQESRRISGEKNSL